MNISYPYTYRPVHFTNMLLAATNLNCQYVTVAFNLVNFSYKTHISSCVCFTYLLFDSDEIRTIKFQRH